MNNFDINELLTNKLTKLPNLLSLSKINLTDYLGATGIIIIIDVKNFKKTNAEFGFDIGDKVLIEIGNTLREFIPKDYSSRVKLFHTNGDEFMVAMKETSIEEANEYIAKVKEKLSSKHITLLPLKVKIHSHAFSYDDPIQSMSSLMKLQYANKDSEGKFCSEAILHDMMWRYEKNIGELFEKLEESNRLALFDDVSQLQNYRAARQFLNNLKRQMDNKITLMLIDGDNLKRYNNVSYQAGNEMICNLSELIKSSLRTEDNVFRWLSGDEFLCVMSDLSTSGADMLAERIRANVEVATVDWLYPVTISIGLTQFNPNDENWEQAVEIAENANIFAKKNGKNMVVASTNIIEMSQL